MTEALSFPWEAAPSGASASLASGLASAVPAIVATRLRLRAPRIADFSAYAEITMSDRGRHIGGPFNREESWLDFTQGVAGWLLRGYGLWSVERTADEAVLGFVLLNHEFGDDEPELGFLFLAAHEGQGYATEAAQAARHFAFGILGWTTVVSYVDAENARSIRLAERLGAVLDADAGSEELLVFRHTRPQGAE